MEVMILRTCMYMAALDADADVDKQFGELGGGCGRGWVNCQWGFGGELHVTAFCGGVWGLAVVVEALRVLFFFFFFERPLSHQGLCLDLL